MGGIICALIGTVGTYMAMRHKSSGKIETSEAARKANEYKEIASRIKEDEKRLEMLKKCLIQEANGRN